MSANMTLDVSAEGDYFYAKSADADARPVRAPSEPIVVPSPWSAAWGDDMNAMGSALAAVVRASADCSPAPMEGPRQPHLAAVASDRHVLLCGVDGYPGRAFHLDQGRLVAALPDPVLVSGLVASGALKLETGQPSVLVLARGRDRRLAVNFVVTMVPGEVLIYCNTAVAAALDQYGDELVLDGSMDTVGVISEFLLAAAMAKDNDSDLALVVIVPCTTE